MVGTALAESTGAVPEKERRGRNLLEMIYEYQLLSSKERHLDIPLDDDERVRRMGLHRLLMGEVPDARRRRLARVALPMRVQFTRAGGFELGEIRDLGGGGVCVRVYRCAT